MMRKLLAVLAMASFVSFSAVAAAQNTTPAGVPANVHAEAATGSTGAPSASTGAPSANGGTSSVASTTYEYRLGSGDKIRLIVFGEDNLGGEFTISGEGRVSIPLIGEVQASGLTATELQTSIVNAFKQGYLNDPKVNVEVLTFRPFYILGEVNKPGEYPYSNGMTVLKAVALAQGFTYRANEKKIYIRHESETKEEDIPLTGAILVSPGDTIRVAERYF